jgi:hypothetical protein
MWVYCETQAGELIDVSREMLGKARELMDDYNDEYEAAASGGSDEESPDGDEQVVAVLIGDDVAGHAEECIAHGADVVVYHEDARLERFRHEPYTRVFSDMARWGGDPGAGNPDPAEWRDYDEPRYVLFPATHNGRDLSAQVQAELDSGLASDCSGLYIENAVISNPAKTGGEDRDGRPVVAARDALGADAVVLANRVKAHTDYSGGLESGLAKMAVVGMGKHRGAEVAGAVHRRHRSHQ